MYEYVHKSDSAYTYSDLSLMPAEHHDHNCYEIYFLVHGECAFFLNNRTFHITDNDMAFIDKGLLHNANYLSKKYTRMYMHFTDEHIDPAVIASMSELFKQGVYTPENPDFVKSIFHTIKTEMKKNDFLSAAIIKCSLTELFAYCIRNKSSQSAANMTNPVIERIIKYISNNYEKNITLESLSKLFKMSSGHLSRLFLNNTGFSIKKYVTIIRIKNAKTMLKCSKKSVSQIAFDCGFNDSNYFSKAFKDKTGLSPLAYRKSDESSSKIV